MTASADGLHAEVQLTRGSLLLDVHVHVAAGETVAVLGPNGAGKTSLLRALAGLIPLQRGSVRLGGTVLESAPGGAWTPPEQRPIGVVFQDYSLFPHLSALDNVAFGLRARGVAKRVANERAEGWLARVGLGDAARSKPRELSGGQAQRVALARALVIEPELLLLDEPLAALDATTRQATRRDLTRHLAEYPGTRIVVTHDPVDAIALASRLVVMEGGRVTQAGTPGEITGRPRSAYVADLVGVNLYEGIGVDGAVAVGATTLAVVGDHRGPVFAVVHPRAVSVHRTAPGGSPRNVWPGSAGSVDVEGDRARVSILGELSIVAEVTIAAAEELRLAEGGPVWASVKATEITVYPA